MLAINKNVTSNAKCMDRTGSNLGKIIILLFFGVLVEFSFVSFTVGAQLPSNAHDSVKRAGFVGMRGKKSDVEDDVNPLTHLMWNPSWTEFDKRAGFVGMRGKKSSGNLYLRVSSGNLSGIKFLNLTN